MSQSVGRRIQRWRWQAPILALLLVLGHQVVEHTWLQYLNRWQHFASQLLFYGLIGPLLTWWALTQLQRSIRQTEEAHAALTQAHRRLTQAHQRLELLMRVNRRLASSLAHCAPRRS